MGQGAVVPDAVLPVDRKNFSEKILVGMKTNEKVEQGGGDEVDMADMSKDIYEVDEEKSRRETTTM
jgi:hypothetical protein